MSLLLEELNKSKTERHNQTKVSDDEIAGLLQESFDDSKEVYGIIGLKDLQYEHDFDEKGKIIMEKKLAARWGETDLVNETDLQNVCEEFNLRFLPTKDYRGRLAPGIANEVKKFCADNDMTLKSQNSFSFYVLAREEDFNLSKEPLPPLVEPDPVLFYKVEEGVYKVITKWGNDLTEWRRVQSWATRNAWTMWAKHSFNIMMIAYFALSMIGLVAGDAQINTFSWTRLIFATLLGLAFGGLCNSYLNENGHWTNKNSWNSEYKKNKMFLA